jgi:uncharacterized protein DUF3558
MLLRRLLLLASLLGLTLVSACTSTSKGDPLPADTTGATPSSSTPRTPGDEDGKLPFAGAPKVDNPLDTSKYEQDPCKSLSAEQAQYLNIPLTGKFDDGVALSTACEWKNQTTRGYVRIFFLVDEPRGLSPEYKKDQKGEWAYFEVLPDIEGYPAIARDGSDERDRGYCVVMVGVADDMAFGVSLQLSLANVGRKDPCPKAAEVAGLALKTMKQGA